MIIEHFLIQDIKRLINIKMNVKYYEKITDESALKVIVLFIDSE